MGGTNQALKLAGTCRSSIEVLLARVRVISISIESGSARSAKSWRRRAGNPSASSQAVSHMLPTLCVTEVFGQSESLHKLDHTDKSGKLAERPKLGSRSRDRDTIVKF